MRQQVFDALLKRIEAGLITWEIMHSLPSLSCLRHADLERKLRELLAGKATSQQIRIFAIRVVEDCSLRELLSVVAQIALDESESLDTRIYAARSVARFGDRDAVSLLHPLAQGNAGDDPNLDLRGIALKGMWQAHFEISDILPMMVAPRSSSHFGDYWSFLWDFEGSVIERATESELASVLEWAASCLTQDAGRTGFGDVVGRLAWHCWPLVASAAVAASLATLVWNRFSRFETPFSTLRGEPNIAEAIRRDAVARRRLIRHIITDCAQSGEVDRLNYGECRLVYPEDFEWLLDCAASEVPGERAAAWARLGACVIDLQCADHISKWLEMRSSCPAIAEEMPWQIEVELGSVRSIQMKEEWKEGRRRIREITRDSRVVPLAERLGTLLTRCEADPSHFIRLEQEMRRGDDSTQYLPPGDDLRKLPGWLESAPELQARIRAAARRFLSESNFNATNAIARYRLSGLNDCDCTPAVALRLLLDEGESITFSNDRWSLFAPFVLLFPARGASGGNRIQDVLSRIVFEKANEAIHNTFVAVLDFEQRSESSSLLDSLWEVPPGSIEGAIIASMKEGNWTPEALARWCAWLLHHKSTEARSFCEEIASRAGNSEHSIGAAVELILGVPDSAWSVVWPQIQRHPDWGRSVIGRAARQVGRRRVDPFPRLLRDGELAHLVGWLFEQYRPDSDPPIGGVRMYGYDDYARDLRKAALNELAARGTRESCSGLRALRDRFPEYGWLRDVCLQADRTRRRNEWLPPSVEDFFNMAADRARRFISSEEQLLDCVCESLDRLSTKLHDELPAREDLWNESPRGKWRPKLEGSLSDYVTRHLREDIQSRGIIVNREVKIRRGQGTEGAKGQITDIHVDAIDGDAPVTLPLKVIIEVKGSWHPEVASAMRSQLVDQYLYENQCRHGLYLVGWYRCQQWKYDRGAKRAGWEDLEQARGMLKAKADEITAQVGSIDEVRSYVLDCALR